MRHFAPIALFVYNRPEHTRRTIKFLQQNLLADESRLFVFSDGPKGKDEAAVAEVRELIQNIEGFKSVEVIERERNIGLAQSVIAGTTKLCEEYGKVIVFEDDLISSPYTLQYFNDALQRYENEEKVMHIGAYMFPIETESLPEAFFNRIATSWGWATWKRAWNNFEPDSSTLIEQFTKQTIKEFSIDQTMNFWKQLIGYSKGKNNSWAIRWYASIFLKGGLALHPAHSLINNIGHDGSGVHSGINELYAVNINPKPVVDFPGEIVESKLAYERIRAFLKNRKGNLWQRAYRFLREKLAMK